MLMVGSPFCAFSNTHVPLFSHISHTFSPIITARTHHASRTLHTFITPNPPSSQHEQLPEMASFASCSAPLPYIIHNFTPSQHEQLPEMATFEEFKKTERRPPGSGGGGGDHRDRGRSKEARPPPSASSRPLQPQQPTAGGGGLSGEALVSEYVKRHLGPHLKEKAITREQYDKIKEK